MSATAGLHPHQLRMLDERADLADRVHKLAAFTGSETHRDLDLHEQYLQVRQLNAMREYLTHLTARIELWMPTLRPEPGSLEPSE
jgi:hypothetical protein